MSSFLLRRLLQTIIVMIGVTGITFGAMFLNGDPTLMLLGETRGMSQADVDEFRHRMGFDRPVIVQYFDWLGKAVRGDFGTLTPPPSE